MTLQELIDLATPEIRKRGHEYFDNDYVLLEVEDDDGRWSASVEGNYGMYDVSIELDHSKQVVDYWCDCPHDEPLCKHVVATAMVIMEDMTIVLPASQESTPEPESQEDNWEELVKQAKADELRKLVLEYA